MYAEWMFKANETHYTYKTASNSLTIKPTDKSFMREGVLFITVKPNYSFMKMFTEKF